jgi:hypothetical protein
MPVQVAISVRNDNMMIDLVSDAQLKDVPHKTLPLWEKLASYSCKKNITCSKKM